MDLQRLGVKFFVEDPGSLDPLGLVPVFHSWIQKQAVENHLLVDVHDYSHVNQGPGILLVGHEGNFSMDMAKNRPGLFYYRKQPISGSLHERIKTVFRITLQGCRMLEESPTLAGVRFKTDAMTIVANDRLLAPNTKETFQAFQPVLSQFLCELYQGNDIALTRLEDPKERFTVVAKASQSNEVQTLLDRLA